MTGRALLLVGSPRGAKGASAALGNKLLAGLATRGWTVDTRFLLPSGRSPERGAETLVSAAAADLLILSCPLYVDQLPAPVILFLEGYAERRAGGATPQRLALIVQCGFPEQEQNRPVVDIVRLFCARQGLEFAGALAMGMGGAADVRKLEVAGGMLRRQVEALDLAAAALAAGQAIPDRAVKLMAHRLMPKWLYLLGGNWGWKHRARRLGTRKKLYDRPFS